MGTLEAIFDFETFFHAHYERTARVIARVVKDPARAEDPAAEVFWKLWRQGEQAGGWLYRTAVRLALDELRHFARRNRYERLSDRGSDPPTPEEVQLVGPDRADGIHFDGSQSGYQAAGEGHEQRQHGGGRQQGQAQACRGSGPV